MYGVKLVGDLWHASKDGMLADTGRETREAAEEDLAAWIKADAEWGLTPKSV